MVTQPNESRRRTRQVRHINNYSVIIRSEVLESVWVLAESEAQAKGFARFIHHNKPDVHLIDRIITEARVVSEQPVLKSQCNERKSNA